MSHVFRVTFALAVWAGLAPSVCLLPPSFLCPFCACRKQNTTALTSKEQKRLFILELNEWPCPGTQIQAPKCDLPTWSQFRAVSQ